MKKFGIMFCVVIQSIAIVAMDSSVENIAQIEKMEFFIMMRRKERNAIEMSLESNSQAEDGMSCSSSRSSSGNFPIFRLKEVKQGSSPRQRESSKKFLQTLGT